MESIIYSLNAHQRFTSLFIRVQVALKKMLKSTQKVGKKNVEKTFVEANNWLNFFPFNLFKKEQLFSFTDIILTSRQMSLIQKIEKWLPRKKLDFFGKDKVVKSSVPYYLMALVTFLILSAEGFNPFIFLAIVYSFFPIMDELFSLDSANPSQVEKKELIQNEGHFLAPLYTAMIIFWIVVIKIFSIVQAMDISWYNVHYFLALAYIISNLYSIQFVVTHELMHKTVFNKVLATVHMIALYYSHFTYHHLYRHHKWVATPHDATTARKGETLYQFMGRTLVESWVAVYKEEKEKGKSLFTNYACLSLLASLAFAGLVYLVWGVQVAMAHSLMAFGGVFYLETISYLEHYGLLRRRLASGEYEKVTIMHSWNAPHRFTNYFLFKLQRHSDHHENSSTPYQALASLDQSPFLPHGYNLMVLMAFFPKTWFRIIDPLLDAYQAVSFGKAAKVSQEIIDTAVTETRKFLLKVALSAFALLAASVFNLI